ncbi:hypothetical protein I41_31890 [Lacipirellula limnantheis]|uniref:Uncharacterized protein n=1 Tax=Lacipirellula limnantheis TaxID=2528024 RepID=A0A517U046_9BACT|nr:hypothetical protein I41_31890 [Lacipirellula limnantheis]
MICSHLSAASRSVRKLHCRRSGRRQSAYWVEAVSTTVRRRVVRREAIRLARQSFLVAALFFAGNAASYAVQPQRSDDSVRQPTTMSARLSRTVGPRRLSAEMFKTGAVTTAAQTPPTTMAAWVTDRAAVDLRDAILVSSRAIPSRETLNSIAEKQPSSLSMIERRARSGRSSTRAKITFATSPVETIQLSLNEANSKTAAGHLPSSWPAHVAAEALSSSSPGEAGSSLHRHAVFSATAVVEPVSHVLTGRPPATFDVTADQTSISPPVLRGPAIDAGALRPRW